MKKHSTLAEQIQQAQLEVSRWSPEMRASVQLQGNSSLISRYIEPRPTTSQQHKTPARKK